MITTLLIYHFDNFIVTKGGSKGILSVILIYFMIHYLFSYKLIFRCNNRDHTPKQKTTKCAHLLPNGTRKKDEAYAGILKVLLGF